MLKFAGQVALFVLCFWLGIVVIGFGVVALLLNDHSAAGELGTITFMCLIFAGPVILGFAIGYAASAASGRGPVISVVVGLVAGCSTMLSRNHDPSLAVPGYISLFTAGMVALASSLGGVLHHWLSKRRRAERAASNPVA